MFSPRRPDDQAVERFLRQQASQELTYPDVGATEKGVIPNDYHSHHVRVPLGTGRETFDRAILAFRAWRQFDVGWAEAVPANTPIAVGENVAIRVRVAGFWSLNACRIVYLINEDAPVTRFGFGYGTLPAHAESGEERFLIEWNRTDDVVSYDVLAFFRPQHPLVRLTWLYGARRVNRFRQDSAAALKRFVAEER